MMETKPYNLQSPEQIAKDYGGNKQKIAEAMQMGILDPTAGTLAGMFIDRMRSAQQQEMAPQQTVAQQVFAPPMPPMPAGLGATPQAAAMAPPPPMGAPMGAPPAPPMEAMPPQGMAMGGLTSLSLPDNMFDEPDNGGYASGGLVAFSRGTEREGVVDPNVPNFEGGEIPVTAPEEEETPKAVQIPRLAFDRAAEIMGNADTLGGNMALINAQAPYRTEAAQEFTDYLRGQLGPEARRARRQEDMWAMLGQIGARMASTPGSLLQAIGAGVGEAVPTTAAAARERRGEERQLREAILGEERTINREQLERLAPGLDMLKQYGSLAMALNDADFQNWWRTQDRVTQERIAAADRAAGLRSTSMQVGAQMRGQDLDYRTRMAEIESQRQREEDEYMRTGFTTYLTDRPALNRRYTYLRNSTDPNEQQLARNIETNIRRTIAAGMRGGNVRTYNPSTGRIE